MASETLFAVSLLQRAPVFAGGQEVGRCVDAMAGCRSGRLNYVVVSHGGVAGVGEVLRRLPWSHAAIDGETLKAQIDQQQLAQLEQLERDEWPAR